MTMLDNNEPESEPAPAADPAPEPDPTANTTASEKIAADAAAAQEADSARRGSVGTVFYWSVAFVIVFVLWAAISPDSLGDIMTTAMTAVSSSFGWIYLVVPFAAIVMLVWFA
ncbi:MAG: BCCT family transporter, partial [Brevibacterium aurantiacum]